MSERRDAVVAVVNNNGKILLARKRPDSSKFFAGLWHVPGETLRDGESDSNGLIRGIMEEAGILIEVGDYIGKHTTPSHREARWYECRAHTYLVTPGGDVDQLRWAFKLEVLDVCKRVSTFWSEDVRAYFEA